MSDTAKRMVKLKWQTIASVIKKATGFPYQDATYFSHSEGFRCRAHHDGSVEVIWSSGHGLQKEGTPARDAIPKIAAAIREAGYDVRETPERSWITVTKEAPPAPPVKPFHTIGHKEIAHFEYPNSRAVRDMAGVDRRSVTLTRTIHRTHEGEFPINEWTVEMTGEPPAVIRGDWSAAATQFGIDCREIVLAAMLTEATKSQPLIPPAIELLDEQTAAWEVEMAEYERAYPGPQPEIA